VVRPVGPSALRSRALALLAILSLAGGLTACGADDEPSSDIPRTSPDLTIPTATTVLPADNTPTNATTTATNTSTLPQATPPAVVTPPPVVAPPVAPPASTTGGAAAAPTGGQQTTGGAQPGDAAFQNFCRENGNAPAGC
jgi:hypothetical protein